MLALLSKDERPCDAVLMAQMSRNSDKRHLKNPRTLLAALCGLFTGSVTAATWGTFWLLPALVSVFLCAHLITRALEHRRADR